MHRTSNVLRIFSSLVENPPFCNYNFNYCSITNIVENYKNSYKFIFSTAKCFFNYKPAKSINTSQECHYNGDCLPRVSTTTIATTCHYLPF